MSGDALAVPEISKDLEKEEALEPLYRILIHNDEVTPYDFVVLVLQKFFQLTPLEAEHITFVAHMSGVAYVATLPLPEAQKRVGRAHFAAGLEGYPLLFTIEPE
jgi:ATP-dependent Clp protease adaptor protein ClpS